MSDDPAIDVVRRFLEAANARDEGQALDLLDPAVEWNNARELPGGGVHHGRPGVEWVLRDQAEMIRGFRAECERLFRVGEQIVAYVRLHGFARDSELEIDMALGHIWTVREGKVVRFRAYLDRDEAVAVARSEETGQHDRAPGPP